MIIVFFLIFIQYIPEAGNDQMCETAKDKERSPATFRNQATILIRRTIAWRECSSFPLPQHIDDFPAGLLPLLHFHFHEK
jgi:hypothetical protein